MLYIYIYIYIYISAKRLRRSLKTSQLNLRNFKISIEGINMKCALEGCPEIEICRAEIIERCCFVFG